MKKEGKAIKGHAFGLVNTYRYIYVRLWKFNKGLVLRGVVHVILEVLTPLFGILLPAWIITWLEQKVLLPDLMLRIAILFFGTGILFVANDYFRASNGAYSIGYRIRLFIRQFVKKSVGLDYDQAEDREIREKQMAGFQAINNNSVGVEGFIRRNEELCYNLLGLVVYALMIGAVHPLLVALLLLISILQVVLYKIPRKYELSHQDEKNSLNMTTYYIQSKSYQPDAGKDVRLYQQQGWLRQVYQEKNHRLLRLLEKERGMYYGYDFLVLVMQLLRSGVCYGYLIWLLSQGMSVGSFVFYLGVIGGFSTWFGEISRLAGELGRCYDKICFYREFEELKGWEPEEPKIPGESPREAAEIIFDRVSFRYPGGDQEVLKDISFRIEPGQKLGLVGINGAGKTTLVKLLCGLYRPTSGRILMNGVDLNQIPKEEYYKRISVIFQDSTPLSVTIGENVTGMHKGGYDRNACRSALRRAGLWEKVNGLKEKEDTFLNKDLSEQGMQLSGGEFQKLMLARAYYKDAGLLVLDEPTAAMDAIAENRLYEEYKEQLASKTSLFISHRLASTRFCDHILLLEGGKITESGTHEELMEKKGAYAKMFEVQSKYYQEGGKRHEQGR